MVYDIPKGYERNSDLMKPAYLKGYEHFFYCNLDELIEDADFDNWVMALYDQQGNEIIQSVGALEKDSVTLSGFRFYTAFTLPSSVPRGTYYFVIYNTVTSAVKYQSNCVKVIDESEIEKYVLLFYRNSTDLFNYGYNDINNYNTVFLPMNIVNQEPDVIESVYTERTTGERRKQKTQVSKVLSLEAYYFDDEANDMMIALASHDDIKINGIKVEPKGSYKIEYDKNNAVKRGVLEVYDQRFSKINLHG